MRRIQNIWNHPLYQEHFQKLQTAEADRLFCRHTLEHFLDVARITYIRSLETGAALPKPLIYAAALLHDIGRYTQIAHGLPHEQAGAELAGSILADCEFLPEEISAVQTAILHHRKSERHNGDAAQSLHSLSSLLYQADKQSRCCFACPVSEACNWNNEKKNLQLLI